MTPPPRPTSPAFYQAMAVIFFLLGAVFIWVALHQHSWFFGAFAAITILNGLMSTLKFIATRET